MNDDNSGAIVFLLAAILCVLLFGSSAVLTGIGWFAGVGAVLAVIFFVVAGIKYLFKGVKDDVSQMRAEGKPWLWLILASLGGLGNFAVFGLGALRWTDGGTRFKDAVSTVPYWWVPVTIVLASILVLALESAHNWVPKVPETLARMIRGWLWFAVAPIASPVGRWREIREQRLQGEQVGAVSIAISLLGAIAVGTLLWPLTLVPIGIAAAIIAEISR